MENGDHTQRILERKALVNVRALVDKVEAEDRERSRSAVLLGVKLVPVLVVGLVVLAVIVTVVVGRPRQVPPPPRTVTEYVEQLFVTIEKKANTRYRSEFENLSGHVRLRFDVRSNGYIDKFEVVEPSRNTVV